MKKINSFIFNKKKKIIKTLIYTLVFIFVFYLGIGVYSYSVISLYDGKVYPNVYVNTYDISGMNMDDINNYIDEIEKELQDTKVILFANEKNYEYTLKDLNITINKKDIVNSILKYQKELSLVDKLEKIITREKKVFSYELVYSTGDIEKFVNTLKTKVDCKMVNEKLSISKDKILSYIKGTPSFSMNIDDTIKSIEENLYNVFINNRIELKGTSKTPKQSSLSTINTKIAAYSSKFKHKDSRGQNIRTAAAYINGAIIYPGESFSFYDYAGPYNKKGYEYYGMVMGNGVCQVASTLYNTTLLSGLEVTRRYQHAEQMPYVQGGLDATVSAGPNGPIADYKFKNTYKYPLYVSAFTNEGTLTIEIWSNNNSTNGKTYKTESIKIGSYAFKTYLITYKDGKQISKDYIATSWYRGMLII